MNEQLHHKWNAGRDPSRESGKEAKPIREESKQLHKVTLKQDKPR